MRELGGVVNVYGLLYVSDKSSAHVNLQTRADPLDTYIRCAVLSSASVTHFGYKYTLITNDAKTVSRKLRDLRLAAIDVEEMNFHLDVPSGIAFEAAHFKLELLRALAALPGDGCRLIIDLDAVMCRRLPFIDPTYLYVYDISDQVFAAYGRRRVERDIEVVAGLALRSPRWYGGEFVAGGRAAFGVVSDFLSECWSRYLFYRESLHHIGDEAVLSAAINLARDSGAKIVDNHNAVSRWWSARTFSPMLKLSEAEKSSILHLPADKFFLANLGTSFVPDTFLHRYRSYARRKALLRTLTGVFSRDGKYPPRI